MGFLDFFKPKAKTVLEDCRLITSVLGNRSYEEFDPPVYVFCHWYRGITRRIWTEMDIVIEATSGGLDPTMKVTYRDGIVFNAYLSAVNYRWKYKEFRAGQWVDTIHTLAEQLRAKDKKECEEAENGCIRAEHAEFASPQAWERPPWEKAPNE